MKKLAAALALAVVATLLLLPSPAAKAQVQGTQVLRVHRTPGWSEQPATFYGHDYPGPGFPPGAYTFTQPSGGFLRIYDGATLVTVWAPGQWNRVEKLIVSE